MEEIAELCGVTPAEVRGTATFYDMLHTEPVGTYVVSVCTNIACLLGGALELLEHAESTLGVRAGGTTTDGVFTLEESECLADCDRTPCVQVNHRYVGAQTPASFDRLVGRPAGRTRSPARCPRTAPSCAVRRSVGLVADRNAIVAERAPAAEAQAARAAGARGRRDGLMAITDAPRIITARLGYDDSYTLERYLATGGYDGLRKALTMTPEAVAAEVDAASLLGRGGAGFPAGRKWSMLRKNPVTYLVINGDESEPATFKDHLLIERDPHQILEGVLISAYALQVSQAFIYLRGEFALGLERLQAALNEAYAHGAVGTDIFGSGFSLDVVRAPRRRRLHLRRGDRAARVAGGQARLPADQAAVLPGRHRPLRRADRGQQRRDDVQHPVDREQRRGRLRRPRRGPLDGDPPLRAGRPRAQAGQLRARDGQDDVPRPHLRAGARRRHPGLATRSRPSSPAACRPRGSGRTRSTCRSGQDEVGDAGSMLGSGSVVVMDSATCMVRAAWRITKFFFRESCGQCTPCREGSGWLERIMYRIENGDGTRGRSGPAHGPLRQHLARRGLAAPADDDLRARPLHPVVDRLGHPHVPRRVPGAREGRGVPL